MLAFVAGLMVGGVVGIITMCLMTAAKAADAHIEDCEYTVMEGMSEAVAPTYYQEQSADESERRQ